MADKFNKTNTYIKSEKQHSTIRNVDERRSNVVKGDESFKLIADRGDQVKTAPVKSEDLDDKPSNIKKVDYKQKIINNFIKQFLPDRGDSKVYPNRTNRLVKNERINKNDDPIAVPNTKKLCTQIGCIENGSKVLIIPETGEKVFLVKTDVKSINAKDTKTNSDSKHVAFKSNEKFTSNIVVKNTEKQDNNRLKKDGENVFKNLNRRYAQLKLDKLKTDKDKNYNEIKSKTDVIKDKKNTNTFKKEENYLLQRGAVHSIETVAKFTNEIPSRLSDKSKENTNKLHGDFTGDKSKLSSKGATSTNDTLKKDSYRKLNHIERNIVFVKEYAKYSSYKKGNNDKIDTLKHNKGRIYIDPEEKKKPRAKYTLRSKHDQNEREFSDICNDIKFLNDDGEEKHNVSSIESLKTDSIRKINRETVKRRPLIKTIKSKNDSTKFYKAVTFVDHRHTTPLRIDLPEIKRKFSRIIGNSVKANIRNVISKGSLKEKYGVNRRKVEKRKRYRNNKYASSPETSVTTDKSPPTEVAKWAPSCVNEHTKPYYEAWVNTTLNAAALDAKNERLTLEDQNFIKTFQKAIEERANSPDLVYENCNDERYTGRIKVRHR